MADVSHKRSVTSDALNVSIGNNLSMIGKERHGDHLVSASFILLIKISALQRTITTVDCCRPSYNVAQPVNENNVSKAISVIICIKMSFTETWCVFMFDISMNITLFCFHGELHSYSLPGLDYICVKTWICQSLSWQSLIGFQSSEDGIAKSIYMK